MNNSEYKNMYEHEASHFFYRITHDAIIKLVKSLNATKRTKVLDVGCGTGLLVKKLNAFTDAEGVDSHPNAIKFAKRRNIIIKKGSITKLPYTTGAFDVVVCIDVLCHRSIKNDAEAVNELKRILKPGGNLIIRVPAHQFLYSNHDAFVFTKKRYSYGHFKKLLIQSGLTLSYYSYMNMFLYIPTYLKKLIEKKSSKNVASSVKSLNPVINSVAYWIITLESYLIGNRIPLPFGIELLAVCQKKQNH